MSKVAIVTGGSKGIGFAVVQRLLTSGYQVHNLDIEPSESGVFHQCDVSNVTAVRQSIPVSYTHLTLPTTPYV